MSGSLLASGGLFIDSRTHNLAMFERCITIFSITFTHRQPLQHFSDVVADCRRESTSLFLSPLCFRLACFVKKEKLCCAKKFWGL